MTTTIGLSGRKGSGKNTLCTFLTENAGGLFGVSPADVKTYSMAAPLKKFCHEVLGLTHEQCYGTDAQKNALTRYDWESLPHWPRLFDEQLQKARREIATERNGRWWPERLFLKLTRADEIEANNRAWLRMKAGKMTGREILQEVGTGIFRRMWADVWNQACVRAIARDNPAVALIDDLRFPDESAAVKAAGGKVVRLHRAPYKADEHPSETAMDGYAGFDADLFNDKLDVRGSCVALVEVLANLGVGNRVAPERLALPDRPTTIEAGTVLRECDVAGGDPLSTKSIGVVINNGPVYGWDYSLLKFGKTWTSEMIEDTKLAQCAIIEGLDN